ncbi:MAG: hypothetical protein IAC07_06635 [Bacteroidetes bacterium]|uniref:DUF4595 domain-containing protein n=1 Tax=Candidatus Cryptobacteroides gallistercoris TaxID=2840765 RepID=A0A940DNI5_9BACT|nr:hypothetical protein [Candidatus Cryptobacteroides gallistercoris]
MKRIFYLLVAAAFVVCSCDSLVPNHLEQENENGGSGSDDQGGISSETASKLVKEIVWEDDEMILFDYDDKNRIIKISWTDINSEYSYFYELKYLQNNVIQLLYNGHDPEPLHYEFDSDGFLKKTSINENYYTEYFYIDGIYSSSLTKSNDEFGKFTSETSAIYENGNCVILSHHDEFIDTDGDENDSSYDSEYSEIWTYTDIENKMNVDIFSRIDPEEMYFKLKGISSHDLPATYGNYMYEYEFDDDGYVTRISLINNMEGTVDICLITYC